MRTANPALNNNTFAGARGTATGGEVMTLQGTVNKTACLLVLLVGASSWTWSQMFQQGARVAAYLLPAAVVGFVVALVTVFKKSWAPVLAPIYAVTEGLLLGVISALFEASYPGIVIQAVSLTFGTLAVLLVAYGTRMIPVTQNLRLGITAATGAIALVYLVDMGLGFFGHRMPMIHESGWLGIGFSVFVVTLAAFNLVLDFDFIEQGSRTNQPKYMEWYAGFGLMVTLVWLYMEILRLLSMTRKCN